MQNTISISVQKVFSSNKTIDNHETYSNILANIHTFDKSIIEVESMLTLTLIVIINGDGDFERYWKTDTIVSSYNKTHLLTHLVEYLTYRRENDHMFEGLNYILCKMGKSRKFENVVFKDYKLLSNPFMNGRDLFFGGSILQDSIDNPSNCDYKERQIMLIGNEGSLAYANLSSNDQVAVKELTKLGKKWYIRGSLIFDQELMMNTIDVKTVYH